MPGPHIWTPMPYSPIKPTAWMLEAERRFESERAGKELGTHNKTKEVILQLFPWLKDDLERMDKLSDGIFTNEKYYKDLFKKGVVRSYCNLAQFCVRYSRLYPGQSLSIDQIIQLANHYKNDKRGGRYFVYLMQVYGVDIIKVGMTTHTDRTPYDRAKDLSNKTLVYYPYTFHCFHSLAEAKRMETILKGKFSEKFNIYIGEETFTGDLKKALELFHRTLENQVGGCNFPY